MSSNYEVLKEICINRRSQRNFSEKSVDEDTISKIIEIANTTPYASGRKNWELVVVDNRESIIEMAERIKDGWINIAP